MQTASKTSQSYWLERLRKRKGLYGAQVQFKGERHYLTFTQDKHDSASKAGKAYAVLLSKGWDSVLKEHSRINRDPEPEKLQATVGNYIELAKEIAKVSDRTFRDYARSMRMIVSEIAEIENGKKRFSAAGAKEWRTQIDEIPLSAITAARVAAWQKMRIKSAGKDPIRLRSAKVSANTYLRQAKSLFGKRLLPLVSERLDVPCPPPFAGVDPFPRQSMRYQSAIDPEVVLEKAREQLDHEPLKILTLALAAGLRAGEIDGLRWKQINLQAGEIQILPNETFSTKSEDSIGTVDLDKGFIALLRGWKAKTRSPFVVKSSSGRRPKWRDGYRADEHFRAVYDWLRNLEIDNEKPLKNANKPLHTLRKEAGSLVNQRHGLAAASMFLRHADVGITARFYIAKKERLTTGLFKEDDNVISFNTEESSTTSERNTRRNG